MKMKLYKIEELVEIQNGGTPSTKINAYWDGQVPWITPKDLSSYEYRFISKGERSITEEGLKNSSAKLVPSMTVLLTSRAPVGYLAIAQNELTTNQGFKNLICKRNICDPFFLYYLLKNNKEILISNSTGATFGELSATKLKNLKFYVPPLLIQRKIASILSAYDDLIENNLKQIKLLEEAAQLIYKEWFVNFRFPGYENTKFVNGLPEGWENTELNEVVEIVFGQSPPSVYYNSKKIGLPFHQGVGTFTEKYALGEIYCSKILRTAEIDDILFSVRAPVGRINFTKEKVVIGRGLCSIRHRFNLQNYMYYCLKNVFYKDDIIGSGSIFNSIKKEQLKKFIVVYPKEIIVKNFDDIAKEINNKTNILFNLNKKLREARDLLLPKLMSGEIEV